MPHLYLMNQQKINQLFRVVMAVFLVAAAIFSGQPIHSALADPGFSTTTEVTSTPVSTTTTYGVPITYGVHVHSNDGMPTGTVTLRDGGIDYGIATLDGSGIATISVDTLPVGDHSKLTVHYSGDSNFISSDSSVIEAGQTITQAHTMTEVTFSNNNPVYGEPVILTAAVANTTSESSALPTGKVKFQKGSTILGEAELDENGEAEVVATLPQGDNQEILATYSGSAAFAVSTSTASLTVSAPDMLLHVAVGNDASGGTCTEDGQCTTLRAAIDQANGALTDQTVTILLPTDRSFMTIAPDETDNNSTGDYNLTHSVNLMGEGQDKTTVNGSDFVGRVFSIKGNVQVNLSHLTILGGSAIPGSEKYNESTSVGAGQNGGAILLDDSAKLMANDVDFSTNHAGRGGHDSSGNADGGDGGSGGAIYISTGSTAVVRGCTFEYNSSGTGGGQNQGMDDPTTGGNGGAGGSGGAIYNAGALEVIDTTFTYNFASDGGYGNDGVTTPGAGGTGGSGGALYSASPSSDKHAKFSVKRSTFSQNRAASGGTGGYVGSVLIGAYGPSGNGAAIAILGMGATITESTFYQNMGPNVKPNASGGNGGAIYAGGSSGTTTVTRSYFEVNSAGPGENNSADGWNGANGGAIAVVDNAALRLENSSFRSNGAGRGDSGTNNSVSRNGGNGGAIYLNSNAASSIAFTSIYGNNSGASSLTGSDGDGAGIYFLNGTADTGVLTLQSSVIMNNMDGNGVTNTYSEVSGDPVTSGGYNFIPHGPGSLSSNATDQILAGDPMLPILALSATDQFGAGTKTFATVNGNVLMNQVPKGTAGCASSVLVDQRGMPRAQAGACEIGAYEYGGVAKVTIVSGGQQSRSTTNTNGSHAFDNLVVRVDDLLGGPLLGVNVAFLPSVGEGATISFNNGDYTQITSSNSPYTAYASGTTNTQTGNYTVVASVGSNSAEFALANLLGPTSSLTVDPTSSAVHGQPVTLTNTITGTSGTPTGTVDFQANGVSIPGCSAQAVNASGVATCQYAGLNQQPYSTYSFSAVYSGDSTYSSVTSNSISNFHVTTASTTTTLGANPSSPVGNNTSVTFTATVTGQYDDQPTTGTVDFGDSKDGTLCSNVALSNGQATCTKILSLGDHEITAYYRPANNPANYSYSNSEVFSFSVISALSTTTTLDVPNPTSPVVGQTVTFPYQVSASSGTPGGTVTVKSGETTICTGTVADGQCSGTLTAAGNQSITAVYGGNSSYSTSTSQARSVTVQAAQTTVSLATDLSVATVVGQPVTVSAHIAPVAPGAGTPTGTVTISDGSTSCHYTMPGETSCDLAFSTAGNHTVTVTYTTDGNFAGSSSASVSHNVSPASTVVSITTDLSADTVTGQPVSVSAQVSPVTPGAGSPTGTVTISDGSVSCHYTLPDETSCNLTFTSAGSKTITATYATDGNYQGGFSSSTTHDVNPASTTTTITSDLSAASIVGVAVAVSAQILPVAPGTGTPAGRVTISAGSDSCAYTLPGETSCDLTFTTSGSKTVVAEYQANDNYSTSVSVGTAHTVNADDTVVSIDADPESPVGNGSPVTFTATVTALTSGRPVSSGTISFGDGGTPFTGCSGLSINEEGQASCTPSPVLSIGAHTIQAHFTTGSSDYRSSEKLDYSFVVNDMIDSTTNLDRVSPENPVVGQPVTFTYSVTAAQGTPAGTVSVMEDSATLCSSTVTQGTCQATLTTAGSHHLVVRYGGNATYNPSSHSFTLEVGKATTVTELTISSTPTTKIDQTVSAHVSVHAVAPGSGDPTGTVVVSSGSDQCTIDLAEANSCSLTFSSLGAKAIEAQYHDPDGNYADSSDTASYLLIRGIYLPIVVR